MTSAPQATMGRDLASGAAHPHVCATPPIFAGVASIQSTLLLPCPEKLVFAQQGAESSNQKGLCGQLDRGYYVADDGKSFNSIISGEKYTLY